MILRLPLPRLRQSFRGLEKSTVVLRCPLSKSSVRKSRSSCCAWHNPLLQRRDYAFRHPAFYILCISILHSDSVLLLVRVAVFPVSA